MSTVDRNNLEASKKNYEDLLTDFKEQAEDTLLDCLVFLTKFHGQPRSADVLRAGLSVAAPYFSPNNFVSAAEKAGFISKIVKRQLNDISPHVLPAVLLLKDQRACIVLEFCKNNTAKVLFTEVGGSEKTIPLKTLRKEYSGFSILIRPKFQYNFEKREEENIPKPSSWFWGAIFSNWWIYLQVALAALFINLFGLASPFFIMMVYDRVIPNNATETLWVLATGIAIVILFDIILKTLRAYFIDSAGKKTDVTIACRIFDQVLDMCIAARPQSAGSFANTLREFETLREFFTSATLVSIIDLPFAILFITVLWLIAGKVALILAIAIPIIILYGIIIQIPLSNAVKKNFKESDQKHGVLVETINGLETIKSVGADARMRRMWQGVVGLSARSGQKARALSMSSVNFAGMIQQLSSVGVVLFGVHLIAKGELTTGGLIACVMLGGRALAPLGQVAQLLTRFNQSMSSLNALDKIMKAPVERPDDHSFLHRPEIKGGIRFEAVSFVYPNRKEAALTGVSFSIKPGEHVGIIGRVGSGKSSVAKLILGLYEPVDGAVMVDETDIRQIDPIDLRKNIGYVAQEPFLFRGSIKDNITAAAPFVEDTKVLDAAKLAGIDEFIGQTSVGYDLAVGERGEGLSGGQRQGITIARALLRKPNILVLDEPTSSMDTRSEQTLIQSLNDYLKDRTLVLVTHRASLLKMVDRIIVMDNGHVAADGPKDQVISALAAGKISTGRPKSE